MRKFKETTGLTSVKEEINKLVSYLEFINKVRNQVNIDKLNLHMVFSGNPGTGKTTVARLLADILYSMRYIKNNKVAEVKAQDFVAGYIGQTAIKTKKLIDEYSDGLMIYDTMKYIKSDVVTLGIALCASMASIILMAGTKGKRKILSHSEVMLHQPLGGVQGQASDIVLAADHIKGIKNVLNDIISIHTKLTKKEIKENMERDFWLSSNDAFNYGIVDKIIETSNVIL